MNFNTKLKQAINEIEALGITVGNIEPTVTVNKRYTRALAKCQKTMKNGNVVFKISLSETIALNPEEVMNTMCHEVLHTVDGCFNHGPLWKTYANKVNKEYGYKISRVSRGDYKVRPDYKYEVTCDKCGVVVGRNRMSGLFKAPSLYKCKCGGHFVRTK